jgi:hypothetical protein
MEPVSPLRLTAQPTNAVAATESRWWPELSQASTRQLKRREDLVQDPVATLRCASSLASARRRGLAWAAKESARGTSPKATAHTPGAGTPSDAGHPPAAPAHPRRWNDCENDQSDPSPGALRRDFPCLPPAAELVPLMREAARPPSVSTTSPPSAAADRGDQQATAAQRHDPPPARPGRGPAARRRLLLADGP